MKITRLLLLVLIITISFPLYSKNIYMCRLCLTDEAKSTFLLDKPWKKITSTADACDVITVGAISKSKVNTKFLWRWQYS